MFFKLLKGALGLSHPKQNIGLLLGLAFYIHGNNVYSKSRGNKFQPQVIIIQNWAKYILYVVIIILK